MTDASSVEKYMNRSEEHFWSLHEVNSAATENILGRSRTCSHNHDHGSLNHYSTPSDGMMYNILNLTIPYTFKILSRENKQREIHSETKLRKETAYTVDETMMTLYGLLQII